MTRAVRLAIIMSILAVVVRLICINQPYIDNWSWRQSDVAAIARNYFQVGFHFAHPQIDWAGDTPGYVGTEFPILPFVAAICYKIFGVHEWVGRIQAVILFAVSLLFFFLLVRKIFGEIAAVWALLFYSFAPLGIMAGRCFMPDMPSLALSIIGLYFFQRWIDEAGLATGRVRPIGGPDWSTRSTRLRHSYGGQASFFASALCIALSILIKLPSAIIGAPLACLAIERFRIPPLRLGAVFQRFDLWFFAVIALLPAALWYRHAYQIALQFYPHHFFGAGGVKIMSAAWYLKIAKEIVTSTLTPFLLVLGGVGAITTRSTSYARLFHWWLATMILFIVIVGYGNRHQWYQLPLIPIGAVFAGAACAFISSKISSRTVKIAFSILLAASFSFSAFVYARDFYRPSAAPLRDAGLKLKATTPTSALVAASDNGDPTVLYYAERKGWHFLEKNGIYDGEPRDSAQAIVDLEELRKHGASYLVFTSNTSWWPDYYEQLGQYVQRTATPMDETSEFKIYKLNPVPK
ncbi:MAG TPA: glycosyltransferase family 39 protein [Chthoniobacterales bacterium]|jgi:4-amino-4-deoxy-L-arabinose transferase-like glycosyltransferase|nr:glycosyltransferase family 39 protein [Chthoniobacterales bacterium]